MSKLAKWERIMLADMQEECYETEANMVFYPLPKAKK